MADLQALFQQSQELAQLTNQANLPNITLGIDQIEQTSKKLVKGSRLGYDADAQSQGQYLLASKGINASHLRSQIKNISAAQPSQPAPSAAQWEPPIPIADTDVEGYRRWRQETIIIAALEQGRRTTQRAVQANLQKRVQEDWKQQRERIMEELSTYGTGEDGGDVAMGFTESAMTTRASTSSGSGFRGSSGDSKLQTHKKMMAYDEIIKRLNTYRKEGKPFAVISYMKERMTSGAESKSPLLAATFSLLTRIAHEYDVRNGEFLGTPVKERQYAQAYAEELTSGNRVALTNRIVAGAKSHLEVTFWDYVEKQLAGRQAEAKLGGAPDVTNKIRAFVDLALKDKYLPTSMETINGGYFWAQVYFLMRSGHEGEALDLVESSEFALPKKDKTFVAYFRKWFSSDDRILLKDDRDQLLSIWNQHVKNTLDTGDPFKYALYKLIGRIEVDRKAVRWVISTMEDWMWYQLHMIREVAPGVGLGGGDARSYSLKDLQAIITDKGPSHFITAATQHNPLVYFQNLLYTGQFEVGIAFLLERSAYYADAVHMAIALTYYGLLRVPADSAVNDIPNLSRGAGPDGPNTLYLNFARVIQRYTKLFSSTDPTEALQYIYLICLNSDLPPPVGPQQQQLCEDMVSNIVLDTKSYNLLLGSGDDESQISTSVVGRDLALIKVADRRAFIRQLINRAVDQTSLDLPLPDLIQLYKLAGDYNRVLHTLSKAVADSLSTPSTASELEQPDQLAGYIEQVASKLESERVPLADSAKRTLKDLLHYRKVKRFTEKGEHQPALQVIEQENLLPLNKDVHGIHVAANDFKARDELITRNIDNIMMNAMTCLAAMYQAQKQAPYGGVNRQEAMEALKKRERALMMFAGAVRHRLDAQTYQQLARTDAFF